MGSWHRHGHTDRRWVSVNERLFQESKPHTNHSSEFYGCKRFPKKSRTFKVWFIRDVSTAVLELTNITDIWPTNNANSAICLLTLMLFQPIRCLLILETQMKIILMIWLRCNHSVHMDYFYRVFMNFWKHQSLAGMDFQCKDRNISGFI